VPGFRRQSPFDRNEIRRPRVIHVVGLARRDPAVHHDDRLRLQLGDLPVEILAISAPEHAGDVDPHLRDRPVLRQQLQELRRLDALIDRGRIGRHRPCRPRVCYALHLGEAVVAPIPLEARVRRCSAAEPVVVVPGAVIQPGQNAVFLARLHEILHDVGPVPAIRHRVRGVPARPQAMARHVLRRQHRVLHPGVARNADPLIHVEPVRCVHRRERLAVGQFVTDERAHAEVDEHAVPQGLPPGELPQAEPLGPSCRRRGLCCIGVISRGTQTGGGSRRRDDAAGRPSEKPASGKLVILHHADLPGTGML